MPSGAKKRKAAKKKKVKETNNAYSATPHSLEDDDLKHHDEKESDGGEINCPASQDHHDQQHPFMEEEQVQKREDSSSVRSFVTGNESMEGFNYNGESERKGVIEEEFVDQIESELKSEEDFVSRKVSVEATKELHNGASSGSSGSSSSDDESHVVEKKTVVLETLRGGSSGSSSSQSSDDESHVNEKNTLVVETAPAVDPIKPVDSLFEVVTQVTDSIPVGEANNLVVETASVVDSEMDSLLEQAIYVNGSASVDNFIASGVVESGLKENGENKLSSRDGNTELSPVMMDLGSRREENEVVSASYGNAVASLDAKDSDVQVVDDELLLSFNAPNGAEHVKDSETREYSGTQPLVASAPGMAQRTSWKSCCGIFELFTGSNR